LSLVIMPSRRKPSELTSEIFTSIASRLCLASFNEAEAC